MCPPHPSKLLRFQFGARNCNFICRHCLYKLCEQNAPAPVVINYSPAMMKNCTFPGSFMLDRGWKSFPLSLFLASLFSQIVFAAATDASTIKTATSCHDHRCEQEFFPPPGKSFACLSRLESSCRSMWRTTYAVRMRNSPVSNLISWTSKRKSEIEFKFNEGTGTEVSERNVASVAWRTRSFLGSGVNVLQPLPVESKLFGFSIALESQKLLLLVIKKLSRVKSSPESKAFSRTEKAF